jgi:hypothetical protein
MPTGAVDVRAVRALLEISRLGKTVYVTTCGIEQILFHNIMES